MAVSVSDVTKVFSKAGSPVLVFDIEPTVNPAFVIAALVLEAVVP
jgi:hypothetical protein